MKALLLLAVAFVVVGCGSSSQCVQPSPFEPIAHCGSDAEDSNCPWQVQ